MNFPITSLQNKLNVLHIGENSSRPIWEGLGIGGSSIVALLVQS